MKPTQVFMKWVIPSSLVILSSLSMTTNKVYAGGYDDVSLLPAEEQVTKMISIFSTLSWDTWEKPYISENNLCRQKNGDVICLPLEMAKKVRAHIYSPKKSTIKVSPSLTAKPK